MRQLTFKGYLEQYVRRLATEETNSLHKLAKDAINNHRLRAPLFLYALSKDKLEVLLKATKDNVLNAHYTELATKYSSDNMMIALMDGDTSLNENYHKVYNSYVRKRDMVKTHERAKMSMRDKIRSLQQEKGVSNYRLYKDLELNPGNVNNFLKNGVVSKLSRNTAKRMISYLEAVA